MKTLLFILFLNYFPHDVQQAPNSYLKVVHEEKGDWINICKEGNKVQTVSFNCFLKAEPAITNPEGFDLAFELASWSDSMRVFSRLGNRQLKEEVLNSMINIFSQHSYRKKPEDLTREEALVLWVDITRKIFFHHFRDVRMGFCERSKEAALLGEMIWPIFLQRNALLEDIRIFSIHAPDSFSVNILVDMSGNIMSKLTLIPDLYYQEEFSLSLINKNSKALKSFAVTK